MLETQIKIHALKSIQELYQATEIDITVQPTEKHFAGDYTIIVFPLLKFSRKKPEATAIELGEHLAKSFDSIESFNAVQGFLNLTITNVALLDAISKHTPQIEKSTNIGTAPYLVEYSSPNTNKPLHLGHIRNNLLGHSISQILKACGHPVKTIQIINDRGIHICKSMLAWQRFGDGETPASTHSKGDHFVGRYYVEFEKQYQRELQTLKDRGLSQEEAEKSSELNSAVQAMLQDWENKDHDTLELWNTMNEWVYQGFAETYGKLGIQFDKNYYESDTYVLGKKSVTEGLEKGIFFKKPDQSVWVDLSAENLDQKLLLRADGTSVYITQDIGTAIERHKDFHFSDMIYTVADEQNYHFQVLFLILKKLGYSWANRCHHLSYGMVTLPSGKMKSREGTVVDADDLIQEMEETAHALRVEKRPNQTETQPTALDKQVGIAALKFHILKVDPKKTVLFDPSESIDFHGKTGPFIQYTHARIKSIMRKNTEKITFPSNIDLLDIERTLIKKVMQYQNQIRLSAKNFNPAIVANYVYELAKLYNTYYQDTPILQEVNTKKRLFRVTLSAHIANLIQQCTQLLGFEVPDAM